MNFLGMEGKSIAYWRNNWVFMIHQGIELVPYIIDSVAKGLGALAQRSSHMEKWEDS